MDFSTYRGVLNLDLTERINPGGPLGLPLLKKCKAKPNRIISFTDSLKTSDFHQCVHFCEHDPRFFRIWRQPELWMPRLLKFDSMIGPDFSILWKFPLYKQIEAIAHGREIAACAQSWGQNVIPFLRWGLPQTYAFAFEGIEQGGTIAVGTLGCMRSNEEKRVFEAGFIPMLNAVKPSTVICIGSSNSKVFACAKSKGIEILQFDSKTALTFKKERA